MATIANKIEDDDSAFILLMQSKLPPPPSTTAPKKVKRIKIKAGEPTPPQQTQALQVSHLNGRVIVPGVVMDLPTQKRTPASIPSSQPSNLYSHYDTADAETDDYSTSQQSYDNLEFHLIGDVTASSSSSGGGSHTMKNTIQKMQTLETTSKTNHTGRDDRATSEQCLDPRTRLILFRMLARGFLSKIDGCLSTGKEANVYYGRSGVNKGDIVGIERDLSSIGADGGDFTNKKNSKAATANGGVKIKKKVAAISSYKKGTVFLDSDSEEEGETPDLITLDEAELLINDSTHQNQNQQSTPAATTTTTTTATTKSSAFDEYAIKVFKTSILVFKDRDKYVSGEHRWSNGYCKSNPRKMVKVWAEKEMRNYKRIFDSGIKCPRPILLKNHVLVMEFLGVNGWPAPRIRDAGLNDKQFREGYISTVIIMRLMFQRCKLVHGDLSEYNLLWYNKEVYVIDVSQSVESDHPSALEFLRKDCANVNDFFRKFGKLNVMSTRQLFEFTTNPAIPDTDIARMDALEILMNQIEDSVLSKETLSKEQLVAEESQAQVNEAVFMSQFIPRSLSQIVEKDAGLMKKGDKEEDFVKQVNLLMGVKEEEKEEKVEVVGKESVDEEKEKGKKSVVFGADVKGGDVDAVKNLSEEVNDDNEGSDEGSDSDYDSDDSDRPRFVKIPMTPEELQARQLAKRESNKLNKNIVKGERKEKRVEKMKKKDKQRVINKIKNKKKG